MSKHKRSASRAERIYRRSESRARRGSRALATYDEDDAQASDYFTPERARGDLDMHHRRMSKHGRKQRGMKAWMRENPSGLSFNGILALVALAAGIYWYRSRSA